MDLVHEPSTGRLYAGAWSAGVFVSGDGAASWARTATGPPDGRDLLLTSDGTLFALSGTDAKVYQSGDGGETWEGFSTGLEPVGSLAIDGTADGSVLLVAAASGGVVRSTDGGETFVPSNTGLPDPLPAAGSVAFDPVSESVVYLATSHSASGAPLYKSTDGGVTWTASASGLPGAAEPVRSVTVDPVNPQLLYVGLDDSVYRSVNAGLSWSLATDLVGGRAILYVTTGSPTRVYASSGGEMYESSDGGVTWSFVADLDLLETGGYIRSFQALAANPAAPDQLWLATNSGVYSSLDAGATWTQSNSGLRAFPANVVRTHPELARTCFAAGGGAGAWRSTDLGLHWTLIQPDRTFNLGGARGLALAAADPGILYLADVDAHVHRSVDQGNTWTTQASGGVATAVGFETTDSQVAVTGGFELGPGPLIFRTDDGGVTWIPVYDVTAPPGASTGLEDVVNEPAAPARWYATTSTYPGWQILRSQDFGLSWEEILDSPSISESPWIAVDADSPGVAYAVIREGGGANELLKTVDGGETWNPLVAPVPTIHAVSSGPVGTDDVFLGSDRLWRSSDGGVTWELFDDTGLPDYVTYVSSIAVTSVDPPLICAGTNAGVWVYADAVPIFLDGFESGDTAAWSVTVQ